MVKIKRLLALMLAIVVSFCFVGCGMSEEEAESKAKEMLAIDKVVIVPDTTCYDGEKVDINILELQMKNGEVYRFIPRRALQDSSESFDVLGEEFDLLGRDTLCIARDDSLKGKDVYLDSDKEENKYKYIVDCGVINSYSVLYASPDLYEILVDKLCNSREDDVIYDSNKANLPTMSEEQQQFLEEFSNNIKVKED